jgi:hypothetical protein
MSWLDQLTGAPKSKRGKIGQALSNASPSPQQPSLPPVPRTKPVVESCYTAVRHPCGSDPGQVLEVFWYVSDEELQICDAEGRPNGPCAVLETGENARVIACRLARQKWNNERTPCNRSLNYGPVWPSVV